MERLKIGDRVELTGDTPHDCRSRIGIITAAQPTSVPPLEDFVVKLTDGTLATFPGGQLQIPHATTGSMIFDSTVSPVPPRFRGDAGNRHMRFVAREFDVYVKISGPARRDSIFGQVTSQDAAVESFLVTLLVEGEPRETTVTKRMGEFSLSDIPPGHVAFE